MQDQIIENQLNLALGLSESEREESYDLNTGFNPEENTWEVIVKYNGNIEILRERYGIKIIYLFAGYAVLEVSEQLIKTIAQMPFIEYMEKPKKLYFVLKSAKNVSCFALNPIRTSNLTGEGVIVAVIDSGVDYSHPAFRNPDGTTRILYMWDQTETDPSFGSPPAGYDIGVEYDSDIINNALDAPFSLRNIIVPETDLSGHGTHVLGIAAGRDTENGFLGCAPNCDIIIVKLENRSDGASYLTTTSKLMQAINYVIEKAVFLGKPLAINLSFGNSYGDHNGTSLLETFINDVSGVWKVTIAVGTGNEGSADRHVSGILTDKNVTVNLLIYDFTQAFSIQIWKNYSDDIAIGIEAPDGKSTGFIEANRGINIFNLYRTSIYVYVGEPTPYSISQEIYIEMVPDDDFFSEGLWKINLIPIRITSGKYYMWLPAGRILNNGSGFLESVSDITLTIPSTAKKPISVGAYNSNTDQIAFFSGRGYTVEGIVKPEIVAPGVDVISTAPGGVYDKRTGTSIATPFVTGAAACLMQWGMVLENDPYLYGDKVKAYLIRGARKLPGFSEWPNRIAGWGALCLKDSLPYK